jgi:hypothetical protein
MIYKEYSKKCYRTESRSAVWCLEEPKSENNEQQYDASTAHYRSVSSPKVHSV